MAEGKVCAACAQAVPQSNRRRRLWNLSSSHAFTVFRELASSVDQATELLDNGGAEAGIVCSTCFAHLQNVVYLIECTIPFTIRW